MTSYKIGFFFLLAWHLKLNHIRIFRAFSILWTLQKILDLRTFFVRWLWKFSKIWEKWEFNSYFVTGHFDLSSVGPYICQQNLFSRITSFKNPVTKKRRNSGSSLYYHFGIQSSTLDLGYNKFIILIPFLFWIYPKFIDLVSLFSCGLSINSDDFLREETSYFKNVRTLTWHLQILISACEKTDQALVQRRWGFRSALGAAESCRRCFLGRQTCRTNPHCGLKTFYFKRFWSSNLYFSVS